MPLAILTGEAFTNSRMSNRAANIDNEVESNDAGVHELEFRSRSWRLMTTFKSIGSLLLVVDEMWDDATVLAQLR